MKSPAIAFSNQKEGRLYFTEALSNGHCEGYFPLAEQFQSQSHYAYCGISSLSMCLNAMLIDPGRIYSGVWRWFDDSMLSCCEPLDKIQEVGITLNKLACLARCNGAVCDLIYAQDIKFEQFKSDLIKACTETCGMNRPILIASYSRKELNQTGSGHFSPLAAFAVKSNMVLILDVERK